MNVKAIYAAPFFNDNSDSPKDGMEKSYNEIFKILDLLSISTDVYKGSETYLPDEATPVMSPAALDLVERSRGYSNDDPLYVVAIGAITNIASALLIDPTLKDRRYVVWLGGHAHEWNDTREFNMYQDVPAARVVMSSGVPFVQLPCMGVVSEFAFNKAEVSSWIDDSKPLAKYLAENTVRFCDIYTPDGSWSKVIWDVVAVAYLLDGEDKGYVKTKILPARLPNSDNIYEEAAPDAPMIKYVYALDKEKILEDMKEKIL